MFPIDTQSTPGHCAEFKMASSDVLDLDLAASRRYEKELLLLAEDEGDLDDWVLPLFYRRR